MKRQFKGIWIPAVIWLDKRLTAIEKVLLAEIDSFSSRNQSYYKTNETIAGELGCSQSTVKRGVAKLESLGLIYRDSFDGRKRSLKSHIDPAERSERPVSKAEKSRQTAQNEPADRPKRTTSNTKSKPLREPVIYPWEGIGDDWQAWKEYKKQEHRFTYKKASTEQAALHQLQKLSNDNEKQAREIIHRSIANGWKGLFALPDSKTKTATTEDREKFAAYIQRGDTEV